MKKQTYTVTQAAELTDYSTANVRRKCQRGLIGQAFELPSGRYEYTLTEKDLDWLRSMKTLSHGEKYGQM